MNTREFLGLDEALALLRASVVPLDGPAESIVLAAAANRVVAETINAPIPMNPETTRPTTVPAVMRSTFSGVL